MRNPRRGIAHDGPMDPDVDPGHEPDGEATPPDPLAAEGPAPERVPTPAPTPEPRRSRRRTWPVLVAILAVVAAILLFLPTTTIARPAVVAPVNQAGTVSMLAVTVERVSWVAQLRCVADDTCYIPNVGGDADGFPEDMPESIVAARIAAQALTDEPVEEQPLPPNTQGPSAGLAFGLAGYLDATGSTLGGRVATTGTLDPYGNVGPVSGVAAKAAIAQAGGIDLLLVPERNIPLTDAFTGTVVEVATLTEAIDAACSLPGSACVKPPTP
jgi:hypothetical protein